MSSGRRKLLFGVFGILFGIVAGLFLVEFMLRIFAPKWLVQEMKEWNLARNAESFGSDVGWQVESIDGRFVRFVPGTQFNVRYHEYNHDVHIDEWGGRAVGGPKPTGQKQLVPFMGDSFVFGIGVQDNETFVSLLNSSPDSNYRFINLGVPGSAL